jgi:exodeoxyribonuclease VII large subunit
LNNNYGYAFKVDEYLCQIQGENAHENIIKQFEQIFASNINYDCVAMVRGGGSETDFKPFEQYELAKLVANFQIPVFTGIGHDRNTSIVDLMARQLKTPTKVAAHIVEHNFMFENNLLYQLNQIEQNAHSKIERAKQSILNLKRLLMSFDPNNILKKGYAILKINNVIVSNPSLLKIGDEIETIFKNKTLKSVIKNINESKNEE